MSNDRVLNVIYRIVDVLFVLVGMLLFVVYVLGIGSELVYPPCVHREWNLESIRVVLLGGLCVAQGNTGQVIRFPNLSSHILATSN